MCDLQAFLARNQSESGLMTKVKAVLKPERHLYGSVYDNSLQVAIVGGHRLYFPKNMVLRELL